jgi:hypothetical protein
MEPTQHRIKPDQGKELCQAVQSGNLEKVIALLDAGVPVDANDSWGTPLMWAARFGYKNICQTLLDRQAEVNIKNQYGLSPLMAAACHGHVDTCQLLLEHNAQINAKNNKGKTSLHFAAKEGYNCVCQLLLKHHAQVDAKDNSGKTPFRLAAKFKSHNVIFGHKGICKLIIDSTINQGISSDTIIAFLGIRKFNRSPIINVDRNIMALIARQAWTAPKIKDLFAQINAIKNADLRNELREYAQQQLKLKMDQKTNNGDSHE